MIYSVDFAAALDDDLDALARQDMPASALWLELIDLLYENERVAEELTLDNGYRALQPRFDTVPIGQLLKRGYNISRLKLYRQNGPPHPHRLLYALHHGRRPPAIVLLGLMPRSDDYDPRNPTVQRMLNDYDAFGIPRVPRG